MTDAFGRKLFSAELQMMKSKGKISSQDGDLRQVLDAIDSLRGDIKALESSVRINPMPGAVPAAPQEAEPEISMLKAELHAMSACIEQTKIEIAALRPPTSPPDRLTVVTNELDAIVNATESATDHILESAEKIDGLTLQLQNSGDSFTSHVAEDIRESVVRIFEECNFQDITGQRINKVVKTLQYIEERINRMIDIWGKDSFADLPLPEEVEADEEKKLLNGPQLANQGISQEDIDKLFG